MVKTRENRDSVLIALNADMWKCCMIADTVSLQTMTRNHKWAVAPIEEVTIIQIGLKIH